MIRFQLEIRSAAAGGFVVRTTCPRGEGWSEMTLPPGTEAGALHLGENPSRIGERLFAALFQGQARDLYQRSLVQWEDDEESSLRLELIFDPQDPQFAALHALPWELLREPDAPEFLALDRRRSIARYLLVRRSVAAAKPPKKLRILAAAAEPRLAGARPLNLEEELQNLRDGIGGSANLELIELPNSSLVALRHALVENECHVLHFLGHGGRDQRTGEQVLYFMGDRRAPDPVSGSDLMNTLAGFPSLRLVVLNACESGVIPEGSQEKPYDPLAGVASALVLGGLPAVVAMRKPVRDSAAIAFARSFYPRLAAGNSIDAAMVEGRHEVRSTNREASEWAIPMLFLRSATGELYPQRALPPEGPIARRFARRKFAAVATVLIVAGLGFSGRHFWIERRVKGLVDQGAAQLSNQNWAAAREHFAGAHRLAPRSAEAATNLAFAEERLGDLRAAEDLYREGLRLAPESADTNFKLGHFLNDRESFAEAYPRLLEAVHLDPNRSEAWAELARAASEQRMFARARRMIGVALRLEPARAAYHRRLGEIELSAGRPQAAISALETAKDNYPQGEPGAVETLALLAEAHDRAGTGAEACRFVAEFRRFDTAGITSRAPDVEALAARRKCPNAESLL